MVFAGSKLVADQFATVDAGTFRSEVEACFATASTSLEAAVLETVMRPPFFIRFEAWQRTRARLEVLDAPGSNADALRKLILVQHCLNQIISADGIHPFDPRCTYPEGTERLSEAAADAMLLYGRDQFRALREVCSELVVYCGSMRPGRLVIIESPLGNVIPVRFMAAMLSKAAISYEVMQVSLPRNDRVGFAGRVTLRDRVEGIVERLSPEHQLLYLDDAITGSRFKKVLGELRRSAKNRKFREPAAVAFGCSRHGGFSEHHEKIRAGIREDVEKAGKAIGIRGWIELPLLPEIDCGPRGKYAWESPLAWGESDLIAGFRKVNLVFNLIEESRIIVELICGRDDSTLKRLVRLWSTDQAGQQYIIDPEVLAKALCEANGKVDWDRVRDRAREAFPEDYRGDLPDFTEGAEEEFVVRRMNWLRDEVVGQAGRDKLSEGWMLWRAIDNLFVTNESRTGDPRDRDFSYYFVEYHPAVARLREDIIAGMLGAALD